MKLALVGGCVIVIVIACSAIDRTGILADGGQGRLDILLQVEGRRHRGWNSQRDAKKPMARRVVMATATSKESAGVSCRSKISYKGKERGNEKPGRVVYASAVLSARR